MPHDKVALVLNGNARSVTSKVIARLKERTPAGDVFVSRDLEEATHIAAAIVERGYGTVLSGGGDGTFTVTLTEIYHAAKKRGSPMPQFGVLKLGTGNAMAQVVRPAALEPSLHFRSNGQTWGAESSRTLRMVETEGFLTPFAGIGADAEILADYSRTRELFRNTPFAPVAVGLAGYSLAAVTRSLPKYVTQRMPRVRVYNLGSPARRLDRDGRLTGPEVTHGGLLYEGAARIVGISTIPYYGFNFRMFPFAGTSEDRMHLRVSTLGSLEFASNVRAIWEGTYFNDKTIFDFLVDRIRVESDPATDFQIGGDTHGKRSSFEASLSPEAIRLASY